MEITRDPYVEVVYKKLLESGDSNLVQLWFDATVLDKYRGVSSFSIIRTDTIGRISRERTWSLDFGIAPDETLIHLSLSDLLQRLPESEREHWAGHIVTHPVSILFLQTRVAPTSCIDDGDLRQW
ncbi:MAG: hypothetical protein HW403_904 [Dehalococcoidia bacterium]|nr:hypothetical protein [Dehalococcoidia bacterium]